MFPCHLTYGMDGSGNLHAILTDTSGRPIVNVNGTVTIQGGNSIAVKTDGSGVTQPISVASLPLPANAAQETGGHLAAIDTSSAAGAASAATTASNTGGIASVVTNTTGLAKEAGGHLASIDSSSATLASASASQATAANQAAVHAAAGSSSSQAVGVQGVAGGVAVGISGSVQLQGGSATIGAISNTGFGITGTLPAFAATPTVNAAQSGGWTVTQSGTWTFQPGNTPNTTPWLFTLEQGGNAALVTAGGALKVDGSAVTQPVSVGSLPLPSGAATAAAQPALNGDGGALAHVTNLPATQAVSAVALPLPSGAATAAAQPAINGDGGALAHVTNLPATQAVSAVALPLPTGAATAAAQPALNGDGGALAHVTNLPSTQTVACGLNCFPPDVLNASAINAATSNAQFLVPLASGEGVVGFTVTGLTASGATLTLEGSNDGGTTWTSINEIPNGTAAPVATLTTDQQFRVNSGGRTKIRLRVSATGTGSITVASNASTASSAVTLLAPLPGGGNVIGSIANTGFAINGTLPAYAVPPAVGESGTWTVQPGNTPNTAPWLFTIDQGGNAATVTAGGALKVDGSAVTQPVSGSFWQATQPVSAASLPLPAGAATAAAQPGLNGDGGALAHVTNLPATQAVSAASLPLPTGAATAAAQPALNGDGGALAHVTNFPASQGAPLTTASNNNSGSITTGGTFQTLLASNSSRKGCLIQNPTTASEPLYVSVGIATGSATLAKAFSLAPGASFRCANGGLVVTDNIAVTAPTTAHAFAEVDQ